MCRSRQVKGWNQCCRREQDGVGAVSRAVREVPLIEIAYGRSGDKGNDANIGIIAREKRFLEVIDSELTTSRVAEYFQYLNHHGVARYPLPGIGGWNFVLKDALGGGGIAVFARIHKERHWRPFYWTCR